MGDISLSLAVGWRNHWKVRELCSKLKDKRAFVYLLNLWEWAAENMPSGDLTQLSPETIEAICDYEGETWTLCSALVVCRLLDEERADDTTLVSRKIHDWMKPGHTGYGLQQKGKERERWRKRHGLKGGEDESPEEPKEDSAGTPRELHGNSTEPPCASRFTVHGSEKLSPPRDLPTPSAAAEVLYGDHTTPLYGHQARTMFQEERHRVFPQTSPKLNIPDPKNQIGTFTESLDAESVRDVPATMALFFRRCRDGLEPKGEEFTANPGYAIRGWMHAFDALREEIHGKTPQVKPPPRASPRDGRYQPPTAKAPVYKRL